ncbi:MAG: ATP-binding protein [Clostridiales Family XIII bacterium]|nr:ATP-binding protein [Clostridiales Family XIII bacterium]
MDRRKDPYSPGAGRPPFALVGRAIDIDEFEAAAWRIENGMDARPLVFYGLRGVGKTVLLRDFQKRVASKGWVTAFVEANPEKSLRAMLSDELKLAIAEMAKPSAGEVMLKALKTMMSFIQLGMDSSGQLSLGMDFSKIDYSNAATGDLSGDLTVLVRDLSASCEKTGKGVALFIDEAQDLSESDLRAINMAAHRASQEAYRFIAVIAGLPTLPRILADINSYAERLYRYRSLAELDAESSRDALTEPSLARGVRWEDDAASLAVAETGGFSYFIQEYGSAVWGQATASPITVGDVKDARAEAIKRLDEGFFRSRWDRASEAQKVYLQAMASDGDGPSSTLEIANRLGVKPTSLSPRRAGLISKGLIYSASSGTVAFTVPQMAQFIKRQTT